ncbi:alpha-(1,3)-fucosyltransferase B-like [Drosophila persimilis]|uniref:alpha-(1,3)-fucosyltransferase B-like n=1 Tax=Drosophila persimilis TaxID=7234 RepID=UPI000F0977C3|nr:alpha-(1,3)-fucosyltransferase B-like [Drosophila persimilis]
MRLARRWIIGSTCLILVGLLHFVYWDLVEVFDIEQSESSAPIELLWWTRHMPWVYDELRRCGVFECRVTNKRKRLASARAVLFYGTFLETGDFPLPRSLQHSWALLHEESPKNVAYAPFDDFLQHFNFTSTFSRYSDLPLTTQWLPSAHDLISMDYTMSFDFKSSNLNVASPSVVFLNSDCDTMSGREHYMKELMRHINVDSFGSCLHNKDLPASLQKDYMDNLYSPKLLRFLSRYKFMIAIENAVCEDYITEKFWRPLVVGVIPIYFGSPSIKDWQPQKKSAIFVKDFPNAAALGRYLMDLSENKTEYDSFRGHKLNGSHPIQNEKLLHNLITYPYHMGVPTPEGSLIQVFECAVCKYATYRGPIRRANARHYNCPLVPIYAPLESKKEPNSLAHWRSAMKVGQCQARILKTFFSSNKPYSEAEFAAELNPRIAEDRC